MHSNTGYQARLPLREDVPLATNWQFHAKVARVVIAGLQKIGFTVS
jgi:hypothetical protein